jgi:hypothetical protein
MYLVDFIISMILILTNVPSGYRSYDGDSPVQLNVALSMLLVGTAIFLVGMFTVNCGREGRTRKAISEESMKYSARSPIPCSWRLRISRHDAGNYRTYHVIKSYSVCVIGF